jgi:excisionase family DNA binding protein
VPTDSTARYDESEDTPLSVKEGARLLKCNEKTLREAIERGEYPHIKIGRLVKLPRRRFMSIVRGDAAA